ncbi:MAG: glycosyltransferase [Bacteroidota bacterium]
MTSNSKTSTSKKSSSAKSSKTQKIEDVLLVETAWEVCNQVGGIYTVIRSKIAAMIDKWGDNYCLLGPYIDEDIMAEFDPITDLSDPYGQAVEKMRNMGITVLYGRWLVTGRPRVVLFELDAVYNRLENVKQHLWVDFGIEAQKDNELLDQVIALSDLVKVFFRILSKEVVKESQPIVAHFHEWMACLPILDIKHEELPIKTVFTTHATQLGRYLAMNDPQFYSMLSKYDWKIIARKFYIKPMVQIEREGAAKADVFTTVSEVTGLECKHLLGKQPDVVTPNGLNIERFAAFHEVQNLHQQFKEEIHEFVMGHFFPSYSFDLNNTLYFFTSGRYEYRNKGYDLTLEALEKLNEMMKKAKLDTTVVMFFITKRPTWSINPEVLESRAVLEEIRQTCEVIQNQVGDQLFYAAAAAQDDHRLPDLSQYVDDYWKLRYRRTLQSWKSDDWPKIITHNLVNDVDDDILEYLRSAKLVNSPDDRVKIVYHPDFINSTNPLFGIDYGDFVRGCHLGIFPSYYEPWGYTPLESVARGVPTITSDLSGFGDYVEKSFSEHEDKGVYVLQRNRKRHDVIVNNLAQSLFDFVQLTRRYRMIQRNRAEDFSEHFDWRNLRQYYVKAYEMALAK